MSMQINRSPIVWRTDQPTPRSPAKSFLPLLRAAVASHPGRPDLLCDLVIVLRDDRRWDEIFDLLSPLADGDGLTPALACELARAAIAGERPDIALRVVDSAIAQGVEGAARQRSSPSTPCAGLTRLRRRRSRLYVKTLMTIWCLARLAAIA
ncbi:hypothetical protein ACFQ4K_31160 [Tistrella bauzanensis]